MEITGNVNNYDWGKLGCESLVAELASFNQRTTRIDDKIPYAELWMGTHPNGPSFVKSSGKQLKTEIGAELPFLLKVLSIRKALSIQVHPNKAQAKKLHKEQPDIYKDSNHKPELAIALTPFTALCGFRPYQEIYQLCTDIPPLAHLVGGENVVSKVNCGCSEDMRTLYENLMIANEGRVSHCIKQISTKYAKVLIQYDLLDIFRTLQKDYPNDIGVLSIFFLNVINLNPGEAIYLPANEIHAYLSGDVIECMACSDNVIRAGLTPKLKDVPTLLECLNYEGKPIEDKLFAPEILDDVTRVFLPPVEDFAVTEIKLPGNASTYGFRLSKKGSILITLSGSRVLRVKNFDPIVVRKGAIVYIPAEPEQEIQLAPVEEISEVFLAYVAMQNVPLKESNCTS